MVELTGNIWQKIKTSSKEEVKELMAKMRAMRKNGNGRLGKKNVDSRINDKIDNFPTEKTGPGRAAYKTNNEHVKCIFVCGRELYSAKTAKRQTPIYLIGFLTDSNRFAFEEFRDWILNNNVKLEKKNIAANRVANFSKIFKQKNIDKDTTLVIERDRVSDGDFFTQQLRLMCHFVGCIVNEVPSSAIIEKIIKEYDIYSDPDRVIKKSKSYSEFGKNKAFKRIYKYIVQNKLCPWMTEETKQTIDSLYLHKQHSYRILHIGLFYALIVKFKRVMKKAQLRK